jgi:hypothetical protein
MGSVFVAIAPLTDPQILAAKTATVAGGLLSTLCVSFFVLRDGKLEEREALADSSTFTIAVSMGAVRCKQSSS